MHMGLLVVVVFVVLNVILSGLFWAHKKSELNWSSYKNCTQIE